MPDPLPPDPPPCPDVRAAQVVALRDMPDPLPPDPPPCPDVRAAQVVALREPPDPPPCPDVRAAQVVALRDTKGGDEARLALLEQLGGAEAGARVRGGGGPAHV